MWTEIPNALGVGSGVQGISDAGEGRRKIPVDATWARIRGPN